MPPDPETEPRHAARVSRRVAFGAVFFAVVLLLGGLAAFIRGGPAEPGIGGPFALEDGAGKRVTDRDYRGRFMLIYFGYTFCPDVCPTTLNQVADALDRLGPRADRIAPIFVTIDPKRDTPAVVQKYAAAFSPRLIGLTGTPEQVAAVAREYGVYYAEHRTGAGPDDYTMDHSSILYLVAPDGTFVAPVRADATGAEMADDIRKAPHMMSRRAALAVCLFPVAALAADPGVTVTEMWSRATPGAVGVLYGTVTATGAPDRLLDATTPRAATVELHESVMNGAVATMRPVAGVAVEPGAPVTLKPGGYHLMLMGLTAPLVAGERFPVTLRFEHAGAVATEARVAPAGAASPPRPAP